MNDDDNEDEEPAPQGDYAQPTLVSRVVFKKRQVKEELTSDG